MTPLELALREEDCVDDARGALHAVFIRFPVHVLSRALVREMRAAKLFEAPQEESLPRAVDAPPRPPLPPDVQRWDERKRAEALEAHLPAPVDVPPPVLRLKDPDAVAMGRRGGLVGGKARAEALTPEERSEAARLAATRRWSTTGERVDAAGQSLVKVERKTNGTAAHATEPAAPEPDAVLRRVLEFIQANSGTTLTIMRKEVHGKIEHISEALRSAIKAGYVEDRGRAPRRELVITDGGAEYLGRVGDTPLPPKHGAKSATLEALLKQYGRMTVEQIADAMYGTIGAHSQNKARTMLHYLVHRGRAAKLDVGVFGPPNGAVS